MMRFRSGLTVGALVCLLISLPKAQGQILETRSIRPHLERGDIYICFRNIEREVQGTEDVYTTSWYLMKPTDKKPACFLKLRGNSTVRGMVDGDRLVMSTYQDPRALLLVDPWGGEVEQFPGVSPYDLVATSKAHVFAHRENEDGMKDLMRFDVDQLDQPVIIRKNVLRVVSSNEQFGALLLSENRGIEVIAWDAPEVALHRAVAPEGVADVIALPSPNGDLLAVGTWTGSEAKLKVFSAGAREPISVRKDIRIDLPAFASGMPRLELLWLDDRTIRYSESGPGPGDLSGAGGRKPEASRRRFLHPTRYITDWDVVTQRVVGKDVMQESLVYHLVRHPTQVPRLFDWDLGKLKFRGLEEVLASIPDRVLLAPVDRWALSVPRGKPLIHVWDGYLRVRNDVVLEHAPLDPAFLLPPIR